MHLTAEYLRRLLSYDAATGVFVWIEPRSRAVKIGQVAGSISCGYRNISVDGVLYRAHRLAWLYVHGEMPDGEIDHKNLNKDDNRIDNLRLASRSNNIANSPVRDSSKSGIKGVHRRGNKWLAYITRDGIRKHIGSFGDPIAASNAYQLAAQSLHGAFARPT